VTVSIVRAADNDAEQLLAIQKRAFRRLYELYQDEGDPYLDGLEEMKRCIGYKQGKYYKVLADGELCGGVFVFLLRGGRYKVGRVYIAPELQGKGYGGHAVGLAERLEEGAREWELDFPADQVANERCYTKLGYRDTGRREVINERLVLRFYEKRV
jgi:GNAT superfamily N-acetyltransferase